MASDGVLDDCNAATAGIAVWDADQRLVYANRTFLYAFELNPSIAHGVAFAEFLEMLIASKELVLPADAKTWKSLEVADFGYDKGWEQPMSDGRTLQIEQRLSTTGGMVMTLTDISNLKRVEFDLRRAKENAEESDESKSRFLRAANHDLRQPLATLKILIYSCLTEVDEEHRKDLLHTMDISVSIMEDLLSALLQIGQLDAGQIEARITTFQLSQIFDRLRIQYGYQAAEKGLKVKFAGARYTVTSDKALLERILTNLLANAIRYTDVGGVVVGCRRQGTKLRIEVWDTGRGITTDYLPHIFDEFFQIPTSRKTKRPGLGLGLNIVKRLSDLLGHQIEVRSEPERGSVFIITVPVGDVWRSEFDELEVTEMHGGEFAGTVVLLVEDDKVLKQTTTELLERWGIIVLAATSETEARRMVRDNPIPPRLIIADYSLRGEFGTDVVRNLREDLGSAVPALIVTADVDPLIIAQIRAQSIPFLIKPVSPPRLRVMMHNLLFEPHFTARQNTLDSDANG